MPQLGRALLVAAVVVSGCARPSPESWSVAPVPVTSPAAAQSRGPRLNVTPDGPILSWVESDGPRTTLKYSQLLDGGWSPGRTVAAGQNWFVSYADPPGVVRLADGTLIAHWEEQRDPRIEAMDLRLSRSRDQGLTWTAPFSPHHDGTQTQHAFPSLFDLPGGALGMIWLDGRESFIETDDPAGGAMTIHYAAFDREGKQTAEAAVDHRVCECCSTAAAMTTDGVLAAFRDRDAKEVRDISVIRLVDSAWSAPQSVHDDGYRTFACPVNGPALSADQRRVVAAWFSVIAEVGHAFVAFSEDAGRSWGAPIQLDDSASLGRVDVALLEDGSAAATWVEFSGDKSEIRVRRVEATGARSASFPVASHGGGSTGGFPRLVRNGGTLVFAWTETFVESGQSEGRQVVKTAVATLPTR